jgi:hypothetical protein
MIEVILFRANHRLDTAEAEDAESALFAARTLVSEAQGIRQGSLLSVGFYVDGKLIRMMEGATL